MSGFLSGLRLHLGQRFYLLLAGESLSMCSGSLVEFALGIWIYSHSGSVADFAGAVLAVTWPPVLILPLAGALADRLDRKYLIVGSDVLLSLILALLGWLLWSDQLQLVHLYLFNCIASIIAAVRQPAYQAVVAAIVPPDGYVRASGLTGLGASLATMFAPLAAGLLMGAVGLDGVIVVSFAAFVLGALLVLRSLRRTARGPSADATANAAAHAAAHAGGPAADASGAEAALEAAEAGVSVAADVFRNLRAGLAFFRGDRLMSWLLAYAMMRSSLFALATAMITPLVLAGHTQQQLGWIYTCGALGGLAGGLLIVVIGTPRRMMLTVLCFDALMASSVFGIGAANSTLGYCVFAFTALASGSVAEGCVKAMWMSKVPPRYHGSVFSLVAMFLLAAASLTLLGGGLLVDHVLDPALSAGGSLAGTAVGDWLGVGKGRGVALLFVISGVAGALWCLVTLASARMRRLDSLVPDGVPAIAIESAARAEG
ncbi:MFS transporter [Burkholderia sp. A1]|uniref:MFS transporter n=2 Tax=unclassified Burkholderia TaxID=2613784 RepID=UPI0004681370|nr:MFS transporter [Burkholderia sp. A1]